MNKIINEIKEFLKEEYKTIICSIVLLFIFFYPVNYYIYIGGGISDIDDRVIIKDKVGEESKGSFNISYVSELSGTVGSYLLSYVIPGWERENANYYKYDTKEKMEDIQFRSYLSLKNANNNAIYYAYKLANKPCNVVDSKIYIISVSEKYNNPFKVGDVLLKINNKSFNNLEGFQNLIATIDDEYIDVLVERNGKEKSLRVKIYKEDNKKIIGVYLQIINSYETDPKIKFNFKASESGSSAGLMTTLSIYDKLTEGDLTNSLKIAGTGTILKDGSVGEIGGVKYKIRGAAKAKADVFLVPSGNNYIEAKKIIKKEKLKIKLIEVKTVEDAIVKLEELK